MFARLGFFSISQAGGKIAGSLTIGLATGKINYLLVFVAILNFFRLAFGAGTR